MNLLKELLKMFYNFFSNNKEVILINKSKDKDYNKQRDNKTYPVETCGPTSMAMALVQAGYTYWLKEGKDPADVITERLTREEAYKRMYDILNTKETNWKPFNIHAVLTWGVNELIGGEVSRFKTNWSLKEILFNVLQGGGAVLPGDFVLEDGRELGHIVSLAGFTTTQKNIEEIKDHVEIDLEQVKEFIIDDPYGNYLKDYNSHHGNNIHFDKETFNRVFRPNNKLERKWAHLIKPLSV